jgi:phosphoribosyl 1,2-cyclic phosphate phosphodiesterase
MKITFLGSGTSQGVPVIACDCIVCKSLDFRDQRLRVSIHIEVEGLSLVIDTGPDFRQQMLRAGIQKIDAVIYTHQHKDHTAGMDDLRSFNFKQEIDIPIYGRLEVIEQLRREFAYIFVEKEDKYPGVLNVEINYIENQAFRIDQVEILPVEGLHYRLPVFGFRIQDFAYLTDINFVSESEKLKLKDLKVLIIGALQKEAHISHFTLSEAIEFAQEIKAKQTYFTHISHKMGLHAEVEKEMPADIRLGYDGLIIEI